MRGYAIVCLVLWFVGVAVKSRLAPTSMAELGESVKRTHPVVLLLNLTTSIAFLALAIWAVAS